MSTIFSQKLVLRHAGILLLLLSSASCALAQQKRPITDKDIFQFQWIGDPQVSPDGSSVVFVRVSVDDKKTGYDTSLWMTPASGGAPIRMTNGKHDTQPRWSPDGKWIAFVRGGEMKDGKPQPGQIALLSLAGGEASTITSVPHGSSHPVWSPDGKHIAFLSDANPDDLKKAKEKHPAEPEHESDVRIITRAVYRMNGVGYLDPKHHQHIWIEDVPAGDAPAKPEAKQLTSGNFDESDPQFTPDGGQIIFRTNQNVEPYYDLPQTEIMQVPADGGRAEIISKIDMGVSGLSLSPDGKRVAFHASVTKPVRSYSEPDLWVMDLAPNSTPKNLTVNYDYDIGSGVGGDNEAPRGGGRETLAWSPDGGHLIDTVAKQGRAILVSVDTQTGAVTELTKGDQAVEDYAQSKDGKTAIVEISTPVMIDELFALSPDGGQRQITHINDHLFSQLNLTPPEELWYTSFDGKKIQAWIQKPQL